MFSLLYIDLQQLPVVIGLLTGHLGLYGHLHEIGKDINPLCRRCLNGIETVEHLLCECESLTISRGRIFGQRFRKLQLSLVPVDLFRRFATEIVGNNSRGSTIDLKRSQCIGHNDHTIKQNQTNLIQTIIINYNVNHDVESDYLANCMPASSLKFSLVADTHSYFPF